MSGGLTEKEKSCLFLSVITVSYLYSKGKSWTVRLAARSVLQIIISYLRTQTQTQQSSKKETNSYDQNIVSVRSGYSTPSVQHQALMILLGALKSPITLEAWRSGCDAKLWEPLVEIEQTTKVITTQNGISILEIRSCSLKKEGRDSTSAAIVYFHGGGYIAGSAENYRNFCAQLSRRTDCVVYSVDYRLCPEVKFDTLLQDCVDACEYITNLSSKIILAGDSAGGGLVLGVLQKLKLISTKDINVVAGVMICPYVDFTMSGETYSSNVPTDKILKPAHFELFRKTTNIEVGRNSSGFLSGDFTKLPPLYVCASEEELLYSDAVAVVSKAKAAGVQVYFESMKYGPHIYPVFYDFAPEYNDSLNNICTFIRTVCGNQKSFI